MFGVALESYLCYSIVAQLHSQIILNLPESKEPVWYTFWDLRVPVMDDNSGSLNVLDREAHKICSSLP